jgi:hypothetical protein
MINSRVCCPGCGDIDVYVGRYTWVEEEVRHFELAWLVRCSDVCFLVAKYCPFCGYKLEIL